MSQRLTADTTAVFKFGSNNDLDNGIAEDIWDGGGLYPWTTGAVAMTVVSATSGDRNATTAAGAKTVDIQGLDADYRVQTETVALAGTTAVTLANQYLRVYRASVATAGSDNSNSADISFQTTGGTTMMKIAAGNGQTLMAVYTTPADYRRYYLNGFWANVGQAVTGNITFKLYMRPNGGAWQLKERVEISEGQGAYQHAYPPGNYIAPKTDIRVEGTASANNMTADAGFDIESRR